MGVWEGRNIRNPQCLPSVMKRLLADVPRATAVQTLNIIKTHCHRNTHSEARTEPAL